jgi:protein O-mannosyl-transferase
VARTRKGLRPPVPHPKTNSSNPKIDTPNVAISPRSLSNSWIYLGLAAAIFAVYGQVWGHAFLNYDDPDYVTANALVQGGLTAAGFLSAFASAHASNWIPLTWLSHMLDSQLFGLRSGPQHLMNVAIHALSTLLLYAFLWKATEARWRSVFVAFMFALHPLHVESVAWIAERKDVLCGLFWMLTFLAYLKYVERRSVGHSAVVALMVACALMAKPMAVTLPLVLLLLDIWPLRRFEREKLTALAIEKIPLIALAIGSAIVTYVVQESTGAVSGTDKIAMINRVANAFASYFTYFVEFVWPSNLAVFYPYPESPQWILAAAGIAALAVITVFVIHQFRERPYFAVGGMWYSVTLLPVIGLVQVGAQAHADRYMYLPMIGLSIAIVWGLTDWFKGKGWSQTALAAGTAAVCATWAIVTFINLDDWRDSIALFERAIEVTDRNAIAYNNLGSALWDQGRLPEALPQFEMAVRIQPQAPEKQDNLGSALTAAGRFEEAQVHLERALQLSPDFAKAHVDLALAFTRQGKIGDATAHYLTALRLQPDNPEAHYGIAGILAQQGRMQEALPHFQKALPHMIDELKKKPDSLEGHYNLGTVYALMGRTDEAIVEFTSAVRLGPDDPESRFNLATALASRSRTSEAADQFAAAVRLRPEYLRAHVSLAQVLGTLGRNDEAIREFQEALRIDPSSAEARDGISRLRSR